MLLRTGTLTEEGLCDGLTAFAEYRLNLTPTIVVFMFWIRNQGLKMHSPALAQVWDCVM